MVPSGKMVFEQCFKLVFFMPSPACCLQSAATWLPATLKYGVLVREARWQRWLSTLTVASSACPLHYTTVLPPLTLRGRSPRTGSMSTRRVADVIHAIRSMLPAARSLLAARDIETQHLRA